MFRKIFSDKLLREYLLGSKIRLREAEEGQADLHVVLDSFDSGREFEFSFDKRTGLITRLLDRIATANERIDDLENFVNSSMKVEVKRVERKAKKGKKAKKSKK